MFNYNSESDESLENMKLDLIKAKYTHQKLKENNFNLQSRSKSAPKNHQYKHNSVKVCKPTKDIIHPKSSQSPLMSNCKFSMDKDPVVTANVIENQSNKNFEDSEEDIDDDEDMDISKINDYVDYLLTKKKISINDDVMNDFNPTSKTMLQETAPTMINGHNATEAYQKCSRDYILNTESTDILAQWRLRRKMNEAQNSVKTEHQRYDLHIHSLKSQIMDDSQPYSVKPFTYSPNNINTATSNKIIKSTEIEDCDKVPVRDVFSNDRYVTPAINLDKINQIPSTTDASVQCQLNRSNLSKISQKAPTSKNSKKTRNATIMTHVKNTNASMYIDDCTQTDNNVNDSTNPIIVNRSTEWDDRSVCHDYIDRAIEKTLQSQLFDRDYSPAMSTVTSINDSQNIDVIVQKNSQNFCTEDNNREIVNHDTTCEDLPWNDHFEIDSDNEFQHDDVLKDLRQRRQINLQKLSNLSAKIQNCKNRYLATIESC